MFFFLFCFCFFFFYVNLSFQNSYELLHLDFICKYSCTVSGKAGYILCINVTSILYFVIFKCPHLMCIKLARLVNMSLDSGITSSFSVRISCI